MNCERGHDQNVCGDSNGGCIECSIVDTGRQAAELNRELKTENAELRMENADRKAEADVFAEKAQEYYEIIHSNAAWASEAIKRLNAEISTLDNTVREYGDTVDRLSSDNAMYKMEARGVREFLCQVFEVTRKVGAAWNLGNQENCEASLRDLRAIHYSSALYLEKTKNGVVGDKSLDLAIWIRDVLNKTSNEEVAEVLKGAE